MKQRLHADNQQGFALISVLLILALVTVIGIAATDTSTLELQIAGNDRVNKADFYDQELSLSVGKISYRNWLTTTYLVADESSAYFPVAGVGDDNNGDDITDDSEIFNDDGDVIGSYRVRNLVSSAADITWEDEDSFGSADKHPANDVPLLSHRDKPDPGSGYDPKNFEIRRFSITAYSVNDDDKGKVILQEGVYKTFNKYN